MQANRFYRDWVGAEDLVSFEVVEGETDLLILAERILEKEARGSIVKYRKDIKRYIAGRPEFKSSLAPIEMDVEAPDIVKDMLAAALRSKVGPMAGVAGAIAEYVGRELLKFSEEIIVENVGDIFLATGKERTLGIFAISSAFTKRLGLKIKPQITPLGVCSSSGKIGHSLSFGATDATVIISKNTALSDCVATKVGNLVKGSRDIQKGMDFAKSVEDILGAVIIVDKKLASWGEVELVPI